MTCNLRHSVRYARMALFFVLVLGNTAIASEQIKELPLAVQYGQGPARGFTVLLSNTSERIVEVLPPDKALAAGDLRIAVCTSDGTKVRQASPWPGVPLLPTDKDWIEIAPKTNGSFLIEVTQAYDLKPGQLYFVEVTYVTRGGSENFHSRFPFGLPEQIKQQER